MIVITILYLFIYLLIIHTLIIDHTHNGTKYIHNRKYRKKGKNNYRD